MSMSMSRRIKTKGKRDKSNLLFITLYIIYAVMIILTSTVYLAENEVRGKINDDKFSYNLVFTENGKQSHYDVKLTNTRYSGYITADYTPSVNLLEVETTNIRELKIDCRSIAKEKNEEILNKRYEDNTNAYKQYFIDKEIFNVKVDADYRIFITFIDVPYPYQVIVNNKLWKDGIDYSYSNGRITSSVPKGNSDVDIYFVSTDKTSPKARYTIKYEHLIPDALMEFNASTSSDDGTITDYLWDFGDGNFDTGIVVEHKFISKGQYYVLLSVRDDDGLIDSYGRIISVRDDNKNNLPDGWEEKYNVTEPYEDDDDDLLTNLNEYLYGTNPIISDTDGDGFSDGNEVLEGTDPLDSTSYPSTKEAREGGVPAWIIITGISIVIIATLMMISYFMYMRRVKEMEPEEAKVRTKKKVLPRKLPKRGEMGYDITLRKAAGYAASKIPPEAYESEPGKRPLNPPDRTPPRPPQNNPSNNPVRKKVQMRKDDLLHSIMMDDELELPRGMKILYECPTCESPIGKDEDFCQTCGEHFDD